ncbi:MAG TPA: zinc-binding dehydrogenase, partial [Spirochaetia bacterium]
PVAFITAWVALVIMGRVREEDRVLIPGAAGGVGSALVQLAARAGAQVLGLVGSPEKKEIVRGFGAGQVLTYEELDGRGTAEDAGFTLILDPRGGGALKDSIRRLAPGGRVISYGVSSLVAGERRSLPRALAGLLRTPIFTSIGLAMANKGVYGLNVLKLFDTASGRQLLGDALDGILEGFKAGDLKVHIGKSFPLASAGTAHTWLQSRKNVGKVVLSCR